MLIFLHDFFNVVVWAKWYTTKLWLSHFRCAKGYFESLQLFFSLFLDALIDVVLVSVFSGKEHICFWWPYCRYTKSDRCSQQGHHCLEGCCFIPSDPHQITKRGWKNFIRCSESFNCDSRHPERKPNEHHKGIQRSFDHEGKGQIYVKYCLLQSIIPFIYAVET